MTTYNASFPCKARFPACPEELLIDVSNALARPLPLPDDYLAFLRQWNGAIVGDLRFPLKDFPFFDEAYGRLQSLYGIDPTGEDDAFDIRTAGQGYAFEKRVPSHILAIGHDIVGYRVCMSLAKESYGHIYYWSTVPLWGEGEPYVPTDEDLDSVADSFAEFWGLLQTVEEFEEAVENLFSDCDWFWSVIERAKRQRRRLQSLLHRMSRDDIVKFRNYFQMMVTEVMDEEFINFFVDQGLSRDDVCKVAEWVVSQGAEAYSNSNVPEEIPTERDPASTFSGVAESVYQERFDTPIL